ncbi:MAG: AMP-binding protein [Labilithrix sp.]|nr:AMP-binding protein [Labilithrix sp.]MBX3219512.1 AMP-binding protein [Labilithrix sp.]
MWNVLERARGLREGLRELPDRVRVSSQLSRQSGLLWSLTRPGLVELVKVLTSGSQNPAKIYRVHGRNSPSKPALIWRGRTTTFAELDGRIDRFSSGLARRGIGRKQSVVLMMRNRPECVELGAAAARGGAAAVSVSWRSTAKELTYLLNHSGARGIVTEPELLSVLEEASPELSEALLANVFVVGSEVAPSSKLQTTPLDALLEEPARDLTADEGSDEDAAVVVYTSGTTGKPKGAVRKFPKDTMQAAMRFINETPMRVDDVHLVTCPLYHSTAFGFLSLSHVLGATVVLMDEFKAEPFLDLVDRYEVTTTAMVPTMLHRVMELPEETRSRYDARSLRVVFAGGAPLPGPLAIDFMDAFGDVVYNFYGATETGLVTLGKPEDLRAAPGTIGKAVPGNDIRLLDDDKREVAPGEVGELYVKNKLLVAGYHKDEEATRSSMVDGYFSVGDLARRDRDGRYFIEGRKRDMVISGGVNVYPAEVEGVLEQHPDVGEVAVVGVPDREWGERVRAFVVPRAGATLDEGALKAFARERLAGPKVPRDFVVLDVLPRNPTGKVLKRELRERAI